MLFVKTVRFCLAAALVLIASSVLLCGVAAAQEVRVAEYPRMNVGDRFVFSFFTEKLKQELYYWRVIKVYDNGSFEVESFMEKEYAPEKVFVERKAVKDRQFEVVRGVDVNEHHAYFALDPGNHRYFEYNLIFPLFVGKKWGDEFFDIKGNKMAASYEVTGFEKVTTPAGEFDSFRIECVMGQPGDPFSRNKYSLWYSPEVRMVVKMDRRYGGEMLAYYPATVAPDTAEPLTGGAAMSAVDDNLPRTRTDNDDAIAVIIGNSRYWHIKTDPFAASDARSVAAYMERSLNVEAKNIILLEDVTRGDIELLFGKAGLFKGRLGTAIGDEDDRDIYVFFSGHGATDPGNKKKYLLPVDARPGDIAATGILLDDFIATLSALEVEHVTVLLDAGFSGVEVFGEASASPLVLEMNYPAVTDEKLSVFYASWREEPACDMAAQGHGLFTYVFLKGIQDRGIDVDRNKKVQMEEMYRYFNDPVNGVPALAQEACGAPQNVTMESRDKKRLVIRY